MEFVSLSQGKFYHTVAGLSSFNLTRFFLFSGSFYPRTFRPLSNFRSPNLASRFPRSSRGVGGGVAGNGFCTFSSAVKPSTTQTSKSKPIDGKCSSSVQTDISALSHQWRSETQLSGGEYNLSSFTLPSTSKFNPQRNSSSKSGKNSLK